MRTSHYAMIMGACALFLYGVLMLSYTHNQPKRVVYLSPTNEVEMLSSLINSECSNCSETEMYLVGSVVLNRMENSSWPNSMDSVIQQERQFQGSLTRNYIPTEKTNEIARNLLSGFFVTPNIYYFCTIETKDRPMKEIILTGTYHYFGK